MPISQPTQRADQRRNPDREAYWRTTISDRLQSGLSIRAFCEREGLSEPAYHYWL
ncbi:IS66 family insertion sequence element accessory protein TnpA [Gimesia sp.]|uniref:IS66 family insertion sequence element accessory protein TnpA n=1 Tax=Gimesia sp. TaxID=2024833 RepID=UPI003A936718